jgi:glycine/D-amino acid oxidase-like deaminating enzyme
VTRSLWDASFLSADVIIVGAGIIGISAAIELVQRDRSLRCVVLERGFSPSGASTRNAGFACFGSLSEIAHDIDLMGRDAAFDLVRRRVDGLRILRDRCGDDAMGYEEHGGHELFFGDHAALARIDKVNALLRPLFNADAFALRNDLISSFGFSDRVTSLVYTPFEGTIDSGRMISALWGRALEQNVSIRTGVTCTRVRESGSQGVSTSERTRHPREGGEPAPSRHPREGRDPAPSRHPREGGNPAPSRHPRESWDPAPSRHPSESWDPVRQSGYTVDVLVSGEPYTLHANNVIVAVNGMFGDVLPTLKNEIIPGRGQVLVTEPLDSVPFKGSFHFDEGYYYFRNVGSRVLLGGGRNTDFEGERTTSLETTEALQAHLESLLRTVILPDSTVAIDHRWAGTMAFTADKQPRVMSLSPGLVVAFGCNGMGVALGSEIGRRASREIGG